LEMLALAKIILNFQAN